MADKTGISWTDHTFNPWWGCTAIAPGCDNCYAAALDKRTGGNYFDVKVAPRRTSSKNWRKPIFWNREAAQGRRHRVFCGSMMDWCDNDAPEGALDELWQLIRDTPWLDWQLLTKRATLIERCLPSDWGNGYQNVWLGVTVEDIKYGMPRIMSLRDIPARVKFISAEPLLEDVSSINLKWIDWVIIGGESGQNFRPMYSHWAENLLQECKESRVPVWFKQWGGNTRDKGGNKILGKIYQEWPLNACG